MTRMPMADYLALPAVSASVLRAMLDRCPRAAWHESWLNPEREPQYSTDADAGSIAHAILLEGSRDGVAIIDPRDHPAEKTGAIPEGWTNKSIRTARDQARAAGKIPVLVCDMERIDAMVESAQTFIASLRGAEPAVWQAFQPGGGDSELTLQWQDGGTPCKARPDRIGADRALMIDAKFTTSSAHPDAWGRANLYGTSSYFLSAAWYRRGACAVFGVEDAEYLFLVCEQEPPHCCSLVGMSPEGWALAGSQVATALREWQHCVRAGTWPSYPPRACYPELPVYKTTQWEERQVSGDWRVLFPDLAEKVNA